MRCPKCQETYSRIYDSCPNCDKRLADGPTLFAPTDGRPVLICGAIGALPGIVVLIYLIIVGGYAVLAVPYGIAASVIGGIVGGFVGYVIAAILESRKK